MRARYSRAVRPRRRARRAGSGDGEGELECARLYAVLARERQLRLSAERRRQLHSVAEQQRQHEQPEFVERAKLAERLDRLRTTDSLLPPVGRSGRV